ncbi:hypothetical protein S83_055464, partial [Arachis hypogaea]
DNFDDDAVVDQQSEIFELWKMVMDRFALPLLIDLCDKAGLDPPPHEACRPGVCSEPSPKTTSVSAPDASSIDAAAEDSAPSSISIAEDSPPIQPPATSTLPPPDSPPSVLCTSLLGSETALSCRIMAEDLVLDTAIRDWVLIPLSVVMVLIGVLRYFVSKLMRSSQTPDVKIVKEGQMMLRARNLRAGANFIPAKAFRARKIYFCNEENGLLFVPKGQAQNPQAQMFSDPNMAMDMMKKNLSMIIPQTLTFAWVNFFFSGFVAAKIPFPLTQRFRSMLQNGIDLSTVDVSYVSSRSWYFLNLFGLRGLFSLILGEENAVDDTQRMMQMGGFGMDPSKGLSAEKDNLDITQHDWALPNFEQRAEAVLRKVVN